MATRIQMVFDELRTTPQDALRRNHELLQTVQSISLKPFMQNKPNFQISKSELTVAMTNSYNNFSPLGHPKSKPNSNPSKPNLKISKSALTVAMKKVYNKIHPFLCQKSKPKQTQFKPPFSHEKVSRSDFNSIIIHQSSIINEKAGLNKLTAIRYPLSATRPTLDVLDIYILCCLLSFS